MGVFYVCDFCPDEQKRMVQHNSEGLNKLFVANRESGFVICQSCVDLAHGMMSEHRSPNTPATDEGVDNGEKE